MLAGLEDLPPEVHIALVHDAARPFLDDAVIDRVVAAARLGEGAVPALPLHDTLKRAGDDDLVTATVPRDGLWRAQTPQAFPRAMIERAYREARAQNIHATDDAALCERLGLPVRVVAGSELAMKITDEVDFARAESMALPARKA